MKQTESESGKMSSSFTKDQGKEIEANIEINQNGMLSGKVVSSSSWPISCQCSLSIPPWKGQGV